MKSLSICKVFVMNVGECVAECPTVKKTFWQSCSMLFRFLHWQQTWRKSGPKFMHSNQRMTNWRWGTEDIHGWMFVLRFHVCRIHTGQVFCMPVLVKITAKFDYYMLVVWGCHSRNIELQEALLAGISQMIEICIISVHLLGTGLH